MMIQTKNGELSTEHGSFLPALPNSEYEIDKETFKVEEVTIGRSPFTQFLKPGKYRKVTADVKVTRYYQI